MFIILNKYPKNEDLLKLETKKQNIYVAIFYKIENNTNFYEAIISDSLKELQEKIKVFIHFHKCQIKIFKVNKLNYINEVLLNNCTLEEDFLPGLFLLIENVIEYYW